MPIQIIAHRACPLDAPENSLAGVRKAAELGADGVEIDIRPTLDGVPVLMHDWTPWRTTRLPGPTRLYPWLLLRRARLEASEERVPTLIEMLELLQGDLHGALFVAIEVKDHAATARALRLVRELKLEGRTLFWSARERPVRYIAEQAPEIEPALLRDVFDPEGINRFLDDAVRFGARAISPHWATVTPQLVGEAHDRGLRVYAMNRDLESVARKAACGLDGIVTDHPKEVRRIIEEGGL